MPIYLQHGNMIDYVPPTDMTTDDVVFIGGLVGIPQFPMKSGQAGSLSVDGIYQFDKKEGVAVNFGDVVKYCGTTKLAQDSNADLTLGVAVADAEADDFGVKVKINSVLPTEGGGGGGGSGEVAVSCGLKLNESGELYIAKSCGLNFNENGDLYVSVADGCGLAFDDYGSLYATGGGGGGEVSIDTSRGLSDNGCGIGINIGSGLSFGSCGELNATGGGSGGSIGLTDKHSFIVTGNDSAYDPGSIVNIGYCNFSSSYGSVILGAFTDNCSATDAVVIGSCSNVSFDATGGIAIGREAQVARNGCGSIAIGLNAKSKSTVAGCGNIVIGSGINPYTDSALLVINGNGSIDDYRNGVLFYAPSSDFTEVSGASSSGGIALVSTQNSGDSWTISCNLSF